MFIIKIFYFIQTSIWKQELNYVSSKVNYTYKISYESNMKYKIIGSKLTISSPCFVLIVSLTQMFCIDSGLNMDISRWLQVKLAKSLYDTYQVCIMHELCLAWTWSNFDMFMFHSSFRLSGYQRVYNARGRGRLCAGLCLNDIHESKSLHKAYANPNH